MKRRSKIARSSLVRDPASCAFRVDRVGRDAGDDVPASEPMRSCLLPLDGTGIALTLPWVSKNLVMVRVWYRKGNSTG